MNGIYRVSKSELGEIPEEFANNISADKLFRSLSGICAEGLIGKEQYEEYALVYKGFGSYDIKDAENYSVGENGIVNKVSSDSLPYTGYALILYYLDKDTEGGMKSVTTKLYFIHDNIVDEEIIPRIIVKVA